jgi:hypothetical protein
MKWTKRHARNAVAAKVLRRIAVSDAVFTPLDGSPPPRPRRRRARFTIQIRDHAVGDSLTLNLHPTPWANRWVSEHGEFSSAQLGRALTLILQGGPNDK